MKLNGVLGPVESSALGCTLMHEHITNADWSMRMNFQDKFLEPDVVIDLAAKKLIKAKETCGITTLVDGTAINNGRDPWIIREVAERSGVNIIMSCGLYANDEGWLTRRPQEHIFQLFDNECRNGIADTGILPGMMKAAIGHAGLTEIQTKVHSAAVECALKNNLNIFVHHEALAENGHQVLDLYQKLGMPMERVILGDVGDTTDLDYIHSLLDRGVWIGMDRFGYCNFLLGFEDRIRTIAQLCKEGYANRMILSHDLSSCLATRVPWEEFKAKGTDTDVDYTYIHTDVIPALLRSGATEQDIHTMLQENPVRYFEGK
ncbi:MAG: phosphotriesterase [Oscillospiraceae bacterium]|nr:phosphotriesterase [Oscillospiraceae bacterium]